MLRPSDEQRRQRAEDAEEDGLGEPLAKESSAAGANRDPNRDLPLPRHRATEKQACDIHARDHEHHQHHARQLPQQRPRRHAKAAALAERRHGERPVAIGVRIGGLQLAGHDLRARRHLVDGRATRQPGDHTQPSRTPQVEDRRMTACPPHSRRRRIDFGLQRRWDPHVRRDAQYRTNEALRRHTDERVGIAVQADRSTDQPMIGIEQAAP